MKCKICSKQKILVKNNNSDKMMWINLSSLSSEEIRELQTMPNGLIKFKPGYHVLHFVTCKEDSNDISKKQKQTKRKSHFSSGI